MVALLVDNGRDGAWAEAVTQTNTLHAPHLMPVEVAEVLRRGAAAMSEATVIAAIAHTRLMSLPVLLHPYTSSAQRVWELRNNVSAYDAWYVALAESLDAPLVTLDRRLSRATGPRCAFAVPPAEE